MAVGQNQEFGCKFCKFYQFSCKSKKDLQDWQGKSVPNVDHECHTWGVKPRGDSEKDRNAWGRITLSFQKAPKTCDILFVGEAPGETEDQKGYAFVGRSGQLMHEVLHSDTKIASKYAVRFTNVVRCWPWRTPNGSQKTPAIPETKHCAGFLTDEIKRTQPKVIVTLGAVALKVVMGSNGASLRKLDGKIREIKVDGRKIYVFPVYHPAYILRNDHLAGDYIDNFRELERSMKKIAKGKSPRRKIAEGHYEICRSFKRAMRVIREFRKSKKKFAYDIEAKVNFTRRNGETSPNVNVRGAKIALVGLCNEPGKAFCIPYFHREVDWTKQQRKKIKKSLSALLMDNEIPKVAQNKKFDNGAFKVLWGVDIPWEVDDTMSDHYVTDETQGTHSLDHLAYQYATDLAGYKEAIEPLEKQYDYDFTKIPLDQGGVYNCKDVDVTLRVSNKLDKKIEKDPKLWRLAKNFLRRGIAALGVIERNGVMIDLDAAETLRAKYKGQMDRIEKELRGLPVIQKYQAFRRRSLIHKRKRGPKARKTWKARVGKLSAGELKLVKVNFGSPDQVSEILYKHLGYKVTKKTDAHKPSTDKEMLIKFISEKKCRFSELLMEYRLVEKIISTYIDSIVHDVMQMRDGMLHGSYSLTGPVTGRTSSSDPNLQNFPNKGDGDVKRLFISRFRSPYERKVISLLTSAVKGETQWDDVIQELYDVGVILDYDYSQIELRILAIFSQDPVLLKIYREGGDVHLETTLAIFNCSLEEWNSLDKGEKKRRRTIAKRVNFGTVYGSGAAGIVDILAKENPPIYISEDEAQKFIDRLFKKYKGVRRWIDKVLETLHKDEQLRSAMGRLRRLREIGSIDRKNQSRAERQGPNALIQSAASDVTVTSLILLVELFEQMAMEKGLESKVILTVHDSIVFDCKLGEVVMVAEIIEEIMTNIPTYGGIIWGEDFDWSWLERIPIKTEGEIGPNYRDKYEFGSTDEKDPHKLYKAFATALLGDGKPKDDDSRYVGSIEKDENNRLEAQKAAT